ncbi:hypothetical protein ACFSDD_11105 [Salipiger marinus]|uniref:hypothetical protein n=1 Tax=Salipiger marinus TaxID=555512 RepID=UPI002C53099A|nr:hypothetical protein [Salipiger manganoxidans]MEB3419919.1 hypothetical protein [Salipiger manganoxidans]
MISRRKPRAGLRIVMKGGQKPIFFETESVEVASAMMADLHQHVAEHGPMGWLITDGLYLNVTEIQAAHATGFDVMPSPRSDT